MLRDRLQGGKKEREKVIWYISLRACPVCFTTCQHWHRSFHLYHWLRLERIVRVASPSSEILPEVSPHWAQSSSAWDKQSDVSGTLRASCDSMEMRSLLCSCTNTYPLSVGRCCRRSSSGHVAERQKSAGRMQSMH